jgi:hypothetical protein
VVADGEALGAVLVADMVCSWMRLDAGCDR